MGAASLAGQSRAPELLRRRFLSMDDMRGCGHSGRVASWEADENPSWQLQCQGVGMC